MAEAATTLVLRMRDEATDKVRDFGNTVQSSAVQTGYLSDEATAAGSTVGLMGDHIQATTLQAIQFNTAMTAVGGALTAVGSLLSQVGGESMKTAATFISVAGAVFATASAITTAIPIIKQLITWLRTLAIAQTLVAALTGPVGWAKIGIGLGIAGAATAGIVAATGGFGGGGTTVNVKTEAFMGSDADARKFATKTQRYSRTNERIGR